MPSSGPQLIPSICKEPIRVIERMIFESPRSVFVVILFIVSIVKSGVWPIPNIDLYRQVSIAPFHAPAFVSEPMAHYLFYSWLQPFIAWSFGMTSPLRFFLLSLSFSLAFVILLVLVVFGSLPSVQARKSIVLFFCLPVAMTSFYWVGYDGLTLLLLLVGLLFICKDLPCSLVGCFVAGCLAGLQHFEQAFVGFLLLLVYLYFGFDSTCHPLGGMVMMKRRLLIVLAGVLVGKFVLALIIFWNQIPLNSGRATWMALSLKQLARNFFLQAQIIIYSLFGVAWLPGLFAYFASRRKPYWTFFMLILFLLSALTNDQTRVVAIVSFPTVFVAFIANQRFLEKLDNPCLAGLVALFLVAPMAWVWQGVPQVSSFPYGLWVIQAALRGAEMNPVDLYLLPMIARQG